MSNEIKRYDSMNAFVADCKSILMQRECENNVILGICNQYLNKSIDPKEFILLSTIDQNGTIISCAVTRHNKTILATCNTQSNAAIKTLATYFNHHQIDLQDLSGEITAVSTFIEVYQKSVRKSTTLFINILNNLRDIELVSNSELLLATIRDLPFLSIWLRNFQIDVGLTSVSSDEEIQIIIKDKIEKKALYKLMRNENQQPVTMVAVVRETDNFAILSWVYTPLELRGNGFATTSVHKLTKLLIDTRQKHCALFTDKSNPVSNKIYQNIGYQPVEEHLHIMF
ncbi:hypothetical protein I4U23_004943 [Adineta vaga]|nr:hypothetical protein I4U23_004943 [Adineta vaga]